MKSDAYKERSAVLSNRGITPSGLKKKVHGADFHKQQAWIEKMSEPKIEKKNPKLSKKYGFGAYPIPKNFSPASSGQRTGSKTSDKIASTLTVDVSTAKKSSLDGSVTRGSRVGGDGSSPSVPKITLRLAELATPRAYATREKVGFKVQVSDLHGAPEVLLERSKRLCMKSNG